MKKQDADEILQKATNREINRIGKDNLIVWLRYEDRKGKFKFLPTKWKFSEFILKNNIRKKIDFYQKRWEKFHNLEDFEILKELEKLVSE